MKRKGKVKQTDPNLCPVCQKNPAEELHSCPYEADIHNNPDEFFCTCCAACTQNCADEI